MNYQDENKKANWLVESGLANAYFWETLVDNIVKCHLCPRGCSILPGNCGFCKSRYNDRGVLKTAIWGKMLTPSIEPIETEAVFHYWPGAKILSLGNLGCNLECDFCQNWESSNIKNLSEKYVKYYKPEEVINLAKIMGMKIISFTYNDPAIWFEYVYETANLANKNGIKTLFKSAAFISSQVAKYLTKVIDIFSISLKSGNADTFKKMSKGYLNNVLDATKIFYESDSHLELSNLVVTGLTDVEDDIIELVRWIKKELSVDVPLHFVRFHPAYRYADTERTSIDFLVKARELALKEGMKYVYIGNTYEKNHADINCKKCGQLLLKRFGLYTEIRAISLQSQCSNCNEKQKIIMDPKNGDTMDFQDIENMKNTGTWEWINTDTRNLHIQIKNTENENAVIVCDHLRGSGALLDREITNIPGNTEIRIAIGQKSDEEQKVNIFSTTTLECNVVELLDRAHFPLENTI